MNGTFNEEFLATYDKSDAKLEGAVSWIMFRCPRSEANEVVHIAALMGSELILSTGSKLSLSIICHQDSQSRSYHVPATVSCSCIMQCRRRRTAIPVVQMVIAADVRAGISVSNTKDTNTSTWIQFCSKWARFLILCSHYQIH